MPAAGCVCIHTQPALQSTQFHLILAPTCCSGRDRSRSRGRSRSRSRGGRSRSRSRSRSRGRSASRSRSRSKSRSRSRSKSRSRSRWARCCGWWLQCTLLHWHRALVCRQAPCQSAACGTAVDSDCRWQCALPWPCCTGVVCTCAHSADSSAPVMPDVLVHHSRRQSLASAQQRSATPCICPCASCFLPEYDTHAKTLHSTNPCMCLPPRRSASRSASPARSRSKSRSRSRSKSRSKSRSRSPSRSKSRSRSPARSG